MAGRREFAAEPAADQVGRATVVIGQWWPTARSATGPATGGLPGDPAAAVAAAFETVPSDLEHLAADLRGRGLVEPAQIVEASSQIARDPDLRALVDAEVKAGAAPAVAMIQAAEHFARILASLDDPTLAARATDVRAVGQRLAAAVGNEAPAGASTSDQGRAGSRILAGWEVSADDLLTSGAPVAGAVTVVGGATAHVGIVARSLGIPILFGADPAVLELPEGTEVLLDTRSGHIVIEPTPAERQAAAASADALDARRHTLTTARGASLSTRDGESVTVLANVASPVEAELAGRMGAPGVGLLRTEMPFLGAPHWPTFDEHLTELTAVLAPLAGRPVTVRTLDFADDKLPPFLRAGRPGPLAPGSGLALMLAEPEAFGAQLRAILRAGRDCDVRVSVMFPMVDSVGTLERCRALVDAAASALDIPTPPVGAMVERPEAIDAIGDLAAAADFLSIGTNDLTASILGLGRRDPSLTPSRLREPAVLDAVARTIRAGREHRRSVSVCGDAASDPALIADLLGLGCRVLSVAPSMMDEIRAAVLTHLTAGPHSDGTDSERRGSGRLDAPPGAYLP